MEVGLNSEGTSLRSIETEPNSSRRMARKRLPWEVLSSTRVYVLTTASQGVRRSGTLKDTVYLHRVRPVVVPTPEATRLGGEGDSM